MVRNAEKEYEVEQILKAVVSYKKGRQINWKYLVKWKGYDEKSNTWEPMESFEGSPKLIERFWAKVDTGGRDHTKAKSFMVREELALREGEQWTEADLEVDEEEHQTADQSASPKARGRKRTSTTANTPTKRKRGRSSKADKESGEQTEQEKSGSDGDAASRRGSRRLSERTALSKAKLRSLLKMRRNSRGHLDSSSESEDEEIPSTALESAKEEDIRKPVRKRQKKYIESDEDEDRDAEGSSHDGSLFSGDDEQEVEDQPKIPPAEAVSTSTSELKTMPNPEPPQEEARSKKNAPRGGRKKPKVLLLDDPVVNKALERLSSFRVQDHPDPVKYSRADPTFTTVPVTVSKSGPSLVPSTTIDENGPSDAPDNISPDVGDAMDNEPDLVVENHAPDDDPERRKTPEATAADPTLLGPPPTADELLRLSGASDTIDDLPDFEANGNSEGSDTASKETITETSTNVPGLSSFYLPQPSTGSTISGPATWKKSLFGIPTPLSIFRNVIGGSSNDQLPSSSTKPTKLRFPLRLDPTSSVPIVLKDVVTPDSSPTFRDLLASGHDGPPGKLFPLAVLQHVKASGPSASIAPDADASDEQREWYSKLVTELDKGALFILLIGGNSFALCSPTHPEAGRGLEIQLLYAGMFRTAVMQQIVITDSMSYVTYAIDAKEIKLR